MNTSSPSIELTSISFFGRALAEYSQFFALDLKRLQGCRVLDVAAGPASFTAEASAAGIDVTAVDPLYGCPVDALAAHIQMDYAGMFAQMRAKPHLLRFYSFASIDEAEVSRRSAAARFLADYADYFVHGRYVGGALPRLPFGDRAFDVVLCAHLLFTYSRRFDFDWHAAAARELVRVSRDEVRLHPLCGPDGKPWPELERLRRELAGAEIDSEVVPLDYEFFIGSGSMLRLANKGTRAS
jgi:SAM-dependent methyltransferase